MDDRSTRPCPERASIDFHSGSAPPLGGRATEAAGADAGAEPPKRSNRLCRFSASSVNAGWVRIPPDGTSEERATRLTPLELPCCASVTKATLPSSSTWKEPGKDWIHLLMPPAAATSSRAPGIS
eukprot:1943813-Prymnesium_polylepis.2